MNNRAQFFLIAAVIIISLVSSLIVIHNKAEAKKEDFSIYDLNEEVVYESSKVIDVGNFQEEEETQVNSEIESLAETYSKLNSRTGFIFIYSNETEAVFLSYDPIRTGSISLSFGGNVVNIPVSNTRRQNQTIPINGPSDDIQLRLDNERYIFDLRQGKSFFTLIKKDSGGERFVAVSEE